MSRYSDEGSAIEDLRARPLGRACDAGLGAGPNFGGLPLGFEGETTGRPLEPIDLPVGGGAGDATDPDFKSFVPALEGDVEMGL
jgi:hypothetical protein